MEEVYVFLLERASRQFKKFAKAKLAKAGIAISSDQWVVLKRISENPGIHQKELADTTFKDPASITRILDILQKKGLLIRQQVDDRRAFGVHLTDAGKELVDQILPIAHELRAQGVKDLTDEEIAALKSMLNRIYNAFSG